MASGYPDWTRAIRLLGIDADGNPVTILADEDGKLYSLITGQDAGGVLRAVRVDDDGQMLMVPRGQSGNYMLVDAAGFLSAVIKGEKADTSLVNVAVDDDGQIVMVPRGSSGNYMSIDSDGFMTAVLKGAYGAALRTIGLDDEGRITAYMADAEDQWGKVVSVGNADLAARLGYPQAWDYRGQVLRWTDFREGLGVCDSYTGGTGASVTLDPTTWLHGGYAVKLVGGSDGDKNAGIRMTADINGNPPAGCALLVASDSMPNEWFLKLTYRIAGSYHHYWVRWLRYSGNLGTFYVLQSDGTWDSKASMDFHDEFTRFHWVKLVGNGTSHDYIRLIYHRQEVSLTSYAARSAYDGLPPGLSVDVSVVNTAGENKSIWVDSVVITAQEPT